MMGWKHFFSLVLLGILVAGVVFLGAQDRSAKQALTNKLWPQARVRSAIEAVEKQRRDGLLSEKSYQKRMAMLKARQAGTYISQTLSVADPPLNFIQNGGFEQVNKNSQKDRSRWLWWGGWSWGGDYENDWESRPAYVHSGKFSACIRCTGSTGRIGISTPQLPAVPGATQYELTFWARGEGENMLFFNFESGAQGQLRQKIDPAWKQYALRGNLQDGEKTYSVYFYHIGRGTIWLDDVKLVPVGGKMD